MLDPGAGHDAGVLAAYLPTASHSPEEHLVDEDAEVGAAALADALGPLLG
ncbi:hypothetical protein [Sinomonas mesophila]